MLPQLTEPSYAYAEGRGADVSSAPGSASGADGNSSLALGAADAVGSREEHEAGPDGLSDDGLSDDGSSYSAEEYGRSCIDAMVRQVVFELVPQSSTLGRALAVQAGEVSINDAWNGLANGLDSVYTITAGGTYVLEADLVARNGIVVNAPGEEVVIRFKGHKLTTKGYGSTAEQTLLKVRAAKRVVLDGTSALNSSALESAGSADVFGVWSDAEGCELSIWNLAIKLHPTSKTQRNLGTHCVSATQGTLDLDRCELTMDFGNQTLRSLQLASADEPPSVVYATARVSSVRLTGCTVTGVGTPAISLADPTAIRDLGNVYGLYSRAASATVNGGSFTVTSQQGSATCLYGRALQISGSEVVLKANAGVVAAGVLGDEARGVSLAAAIRFSCDDDYVDAAEVLSTLRSGVDNAFVLQAKGAPEGRGEYSVLVMKGALDTANAPGDKIAILGALSDEQKAAWAAGLRNALGEDAVCAVEVDASTICFALDEAHAAAKIGNTLFGSAATALASARDGDTVMLLADAKAISFDRPIRLTFDLNGHSITSLRYAATSPSSGEEAPDAGLTVRNGTVNGYASTSEGLAAVLFASSFPLTLSNVRIVAAGSDNIVSGVYASPAAKGALELQHTEVSATAQRSASSASAYGVRIDRASSATLAIGQASAIKASTSSAGTPVYGIYSPARASVADSAVVVVGGTDTACGLLVGGTLDIRDSAVNVTVAGESANGYAIWASTANPIAERIGVDGVSLRVNAQGEGAQGDLVCLAEATGSSESSSCVWTLAGTCLFESAGGMHIGRNVSQMHLSASFALSDRGDQTIAVSQARLAGDIGFAGDAGSDITAFAQAFVAAPGSTYEGWRLASASADRSQLVWHPAGAPADGAVELVHGASSRRYQCLADALADAQAADTIRLLSDLSEAGAFRIGVEGLTIDLAGHDLTVRAGERAAESSGTGAAIAFAGHEGAVLQLMSSGGEGALGIEAGSSIEPASGAVYQGVSVIGGGTLAVADSCTVRVSYTGGSAQAAQRDVALRGIALSSGSLDLQGKLEVRALADGALTGALHAQGVFAQASEGSSVTVAQTSSSRISVENATAPGKVESTFYAESASTSSSPEALREITVDAERDSGFYQAICNQFLVSATYDNPDSYVAGTAFGAGIYYVSGMALAAEGEWYDGLKVWAFSDVVSPTNVGKHEYIRPSHIFVATGYEQVPDAAGVVSGSGSAGKVSVTVAGTVSAECGDGDAVALDALGGAMASWRCVGAELSASAGTRAHIVAGRGFDLRDFITFSKTIDRTVAYRGMTTSKLAAFVPTAARDMRVSDGASFRLEGRLALSASAQDRASIEAAAFEVGPRFSVADGGVCTVANARGSNEAGAVFAVPSGSAGNVDASLFADSYALYAATPATGGAVAWGDRPDSGGLVTFMVGEATVGRFAVGERVDLAEPSALALREDDARQSYRLAGWSLSEDESVQPDLPVRGTFEATGPATYHAVYEIGATSDITIAFSNVHAAGGSTVDVGAVPAQYGQTVGEALAAQGRSLPVPQDYADEASGLTYRFVGWHAYSSTAPSTAQMWRSESVADAMRVTVALSGVASGTLELRAMYVPVGAGQHLVSFAVDGRISAYAADDGTRPAYWKANGTNANSSAPTKVNAAAGVKYELEAWVDEADGHAYADALPLVREDAAYSAKFSEKADDVTLAFYILQRSSSSSGYTVSPSIVHTNYETSVQKAADGVAKIGSTLAYGERVYTLTGWTVRDTDVDALYDADHPIPSGNWDERLVSSSAYSRSYYAVYATADHEVEVSFYDGTACLGSASVSSSSTIDQAFAATECTVPENRTSGQVFLGWNTQADAQAELDSAATFISALVDPASKDLSLYAVFGSAHASTVRLYDADRTRVLYELRVTQGKSVAAVLAEQGRTIATPTQEGRYFTGWRTPAGALYDLSAPVTGAANLAASFADVQVQSQDASDATATVTCSLAGLENSQSVVFSLAPAQSADRPLRTKTAENSYTILKSYYMQLYSVDADGGRRSLTGSIGTATVKVFVGTQYRNASVRAFWIGDSNGAERVANSAVKQVDANGYITVSIGDYQLGDWGEGGNLAIAYLEGSGSKTTSGIRKLSLSSSTLNRAALNSLKDLTPEKLAAKLKELKQVSADGAAELKAKAEAAKKKKDAASDAVGDLEVEGGDGGAQDDGGEGGSVGDAVASLFDGWDSSGVVLVLLAAAVLAVALRGAWRLFAKPRDDADEAIPEGAAPAARSIEF